MKIDNNNPVNNAYNTIQVIKDKEQKINRSVKSVRDNPYKDSYDKRIQNESILTLEEENKMKKELERHINELVKVLGMDVKFELKKESHKITVQVIDLRTGTILKEISGMDFLRLTQAITDILGS